MDDHTPPRSLHEETAAVADEPAPVSVERVHQLLLLGLARMERKQAALSSDFNALYLTILQLQRDVNFFTRRCEERGNLIREYLARLQENGAVDKDAAVEFLQQLECAGTPVRSPSGDHPAVSAAHGEFDFDEPTDPSKPR